MDPDRTAVHGYLLAKGLVISFDETVADWTNAVFDQMLPVPIEESSREEINWDDWDWSKEMKWTITQEQSQLLKRFGPNQFNFPPQEIVVRPRYSPIHLSDEFVLSRSSITAGLKSIKTEKPADYRKVFRQLARDGTGGTKGYFEVEDDAEMDELEVLPEINTALNLKLGATKAGFQLLQSYRAERKQDGRDDTAIILSNNSPGYRLDPVQLPESFRITSPIIFPRDGKPPDSFPTFIELVTDVLKIPDQVEAIDFSSPRGAGMSMTAWNAIERNPPYLSPKTEINSSPRPIWSSPTPYTTPHSDSRLELEIPIFPRVKVEYELDGLWNLPVRMSEFPDQDIDELEEDLPGLLDEVVLPFHSSLWSRFDELESKEATGEPLIDTRLEVISLLPHSTSPIPFPQSILDFTPDSATRWSLRGRFELQRLTIDQEWNSFSVPHGDTLHGDIIGALSDERVENVEIMKAEFEKQFEQDDFQESIVTNGRYIREEEEKEEGIQARVDLVREVEVDSTEDGMGVDIGMMITEALNESTDGSEEMELIPAESPPFQSNFLDLLDPIPIDSPAPMFSPPLVDQELYLLSPVPSFLSMGILQGTTDRNSSPPASFLHLPDIELSSRSDEAQIFESVSASSSSEKSKDLEEEQEIENVIEESESRSAASGGILEMRDYSSRVVEFKEEIEVTPWRGSNDLANFLATRSNYRPRPVSSILSKQPIPSRPAVAPVVSRPTNPARAPPVLPFRPLSFLSVINPIDTTPIRCVVSSDMLQQPLLHKSLESQNLILLDRPNQNSAPSSLLNIDGRSVIKFFQLNRIINDTARAGLMKELLDLTVQFEGILLVMVEVDGTGGIRAYPFTLPVVLALEELKKEMEEGIDCLVEVGFAKSSMDAALIARKYVDYQRGEFEIDRDGNGVLWDERDWITEELTKDESYLLQLKELNSISACYILQISNVDNFVLISTEERQEAFGQLFGPYRIDRISTFISARREEMATTEQETQISSPPPYMEVPGSTQEMIGWGREG